jgi:hypothetical protein
MSDFYFAFANPERFLLVYIECRGGDSGKHSRISMA